MHVLTMLCCVQEVDMDESCPITALRDQKGCIVTEAVPANTLLGAYRAYLLSTRDLSRLART